MLIEFSVSNFRSFRDKQTLSLVAAPRLRKKQNTFKVDLAGEKFPDLLKTCVIYGPNASGKSNLLRALSTVDRIANMAPGSKELLPVSPFGFDPELIAQPSKFEIHFIHQKMRYQFELWVTDERVYLERLHWFPKGKETLLYERRYENQIEHYEVGETLEGGAEVHEAWKRLTAPNVLFIAQAVANSREELKQLRAPFEWLTQAIYPVLNGMGTLTNATRRLTSRHTVASDQLAAFLQDVDVPVSKVKSEQAEGSLSDETDAEVLKRRQERFLRTTFTHYSALGEADIRFEDESEGTKSLVGFWLPWSTREPYLDNQRCVLTVDELDSSLHPKIVIALVAKHLASETPTQLIFSTHDTHLMDAKLLRRDQFWITERDVNGATQLRSIHDFEGRDSEDVEKRYYEGRYRGLPFLKDS